jgi:hypothetical protein
MGWGFVHIFFFCVFFWAAVLKPIPRNMEGGGGGGGGKKEGRKGEDTHHRQRITAIYITATLQLLKRHTASSKYLCLEASVSNDNEF